MRINYFNDLIHQHCHVQPNARAALSILALDKVHLALCTGSRVSQWVSNESWFSCHVASLKTLYQFVIVITRFTDKGISIKRIFDRMISLIYSSAMQMHHGRSFKFAQIRINACERDKIKLIKQGYEKSKIVWEKYINMIRNQYLLSLSFFHA